MLYKIAIDGPASSGKSTVAKILAKNNNLTFISTGYLFRAYALILRNNNCLDQSSDEVISLLKKRMIELKNEKLFIDGKDYTNESKSEQISDFASTLATKDYIRAYYNHVVQKQIENLSVVMDGRDIGTIIMPNANLKIYLTASITERAKRRTKELRELGKKVNFFKIWIDIFRRDYADKHRKIAPLKKAKDAILVKTNNKSIEQVVNIIQQHINIPKE